MAAAVSQVDAATEAMASASVSDAPGTGVNEVVIGIDLGTTFSCVAAWNEKTGAVEVLDNMQGKRTTPSFVSFTATGRVVGQPAKDQAAMNPNNTLYDVKRIIGRAWNDGVVQDEKKQFPFKMVESDQGTPLLEVDWRGEARRLSPEEVSAMILTEMRRSAEKALGHPVSKAVVTVPAHFNDQQRQATKDAGKIAGLDVLRIINEPTAAALAYGLQEKSGAEADGATNVVIFDLGGGTFDVSVLSLDGGVFEVKATGGDTHLGGEDFDNALLAWCFDKIEETSGLGKAKVDEFRANGRISRRLRKAAESAKRMLSTVETTLVEVEGLTEDLDVSIELTRAKFTELNGELFTRCIDTVRSVLKDAAVEIDNVTDCVLVGGSTRVLHLQDQLRELFGGRLDMCKTINPDEAVAYGAAVQGRILSSGGTGGGTDLMLGGCTDLLLLDVTPLSLGIELEGKQMSTLIKRNTAIPVRKSRTYTTVADWQTEIDVVVYEGERPCVDANNKLGEFLISGCERAKAGVAQVEVTFALDANGILNVTARDKVTNAVANAEIKADKGRLPEEEIERMIAEAEQYRAQDEESGQKLQMKNGIEAAMYKALGLARDRGDEEAQEQIENIRDWLEFDADDAPLSEYEQRAEILKSNFGVSVMTN